MPNDYISHLKILYYRKFKDRIERNSCAGTGGWIIGGAKGYVGPPSQIIGGAWPPPPPGSPLPTPMNQWQGLLVCAYKVVDYVSRFASVAMQITRYFLGAAV